MPEWIIYVLIPLISAIIGGGLTLAGVVVTINWETKQKKQEEIEKVKPIIINYDYAAIESNERFPIFNFYAVDDSVKTEHVFDCLFKNTDNGILFFDYIESERKKYLTFDGAAVDKNTVFCVIIRNIIGESLKGFKIYCHDILGNEYYYEAKYNPKHRSNGDLIIGTITPVKKSKLKIRKNYEL